LPAGSGWFSAKESRQWWFSLGRREKVWAAFITRVGYAIAGFIFLCAAISVVSTAMLEDRTNQDISREYLTV